MPLKWEIETSNFDLFKVTHSDMSNMKYQKNLRTFNAYKTIFENDLTSKNQESNDD